MSQRLEPEAGVLYIVGTPIGNLGDLSPRARGILKNVSAIACEDTRHSGQLAQKLELQTPLISFHRHNTKNRVPKLLSFLENGQSLALISDAGLPGISDPGEELVLAAKEAGFDVICIPGPCAATTALVSSGLPSSRFCFEGFLASRGRERKNRLVAIAKETRTTVIYEAPHRLLQLLKELHQLCGDERQLLITRELTKRHEEHIGPTIGAALEHFLIHKPQGECTVVLGGAPPSISPQLDDKELIQRMKDLMSNGATASEAARTLSENCSYPRRYLYSLLHKDKGAKTIKL